MQHTSLKPVIVLLFIYCSRLKTRAAQGMRIVGGALVSDDSPAEHMIGSKSGAIPQSDSCVEEDGNDGGKSAIREDLWKMAWRHVRLSLCFETPGNELLGHFCKHIKELYIGGKEEEFKYSHYVQNLLELVPALARRRVRVSETISPLDGVARDSWLEIIDSDDVDFKAGSSSRLTKHASSQLHREVLALLRIVWPSDSVAYGALLRTICDIAFGGEYSLMEVTTPTTCKRVVLAPVDLKLRLDCCDLLQSILCKIVGKQERVKNQADEDGLLFSPPTSDAWIAVTADVISSRCWENLCLVLFQRRCFSITRDVPHATSFRDLRIRTTPYHQNSRSVPDDVIISIRQLAVLEIGRFETSYEWSKSGLIVPILCILQHLCEMPKAFVLAEKAWANIIDIVSCAIVPWASWELQWQWRASSQEEFSQLFDTVYDNNNSFPVLLYNAAAFSVEPIVEDDDATNMATINLLDMLVQLVSNTRYVSSS